MQNFSVVFVLVVLSSSLPLWAQQSTGSLPKPQLASLPITFERNLGQAPADYPFLSRSGSVSAFFRSTGADLLLPGKDSGNHRVSFELLASRADVLVEGGDLLTGVSNYLVGNDPNRWIRGVPLQSQIVYRGIYPRIDLVFHGAGGELEQDFRVSAGADPGLIRFAVKGARGLALSSDGDLAISLGDDTLFFRKPQAYQETGAGRRNVECHFLVKEDRSVVFKLGEYDRSRELVIDPVFVFSTYLAGNSADWPTAITSDSGGNVYVTGYTDSTAFPVENGIQPSAHGSPDVFVSKLDPSGKTLLYSTYLGGSSRNYGNSIAVDASGNVIVAGTSSSNDFPHAGSVPSLTCGGNNDCFFLVSLKPDGSSFNYAGLVGGIEGTDALSGGGPGAGSIVIDGAGNAYLTGVTDDGHFEITPGTLSTAVQGNGYPFNSAFVMKVSPAGAIVYSTIVPGTAGENLSGYLNNVFVPAGISVDSNGQATIAGTAGPGLPSTPGVIQAAFPNDLTVESPSAGFVLQLNATASAVNYATYIPGTDSIGGYAVDPSGNSYFTGGTSETDLPVTSNAYQKTIKAGTNCTCNSGFILKLNPTGTTVLAATYLEGTPSSSNAGTKFTGLALDRDSNVFVGGITGSTDFPLLDAFTTQWVFGTTEGDMVLAEMSPDLSSLLFGSFLSSTDQVFAASSFAGITLDTQNHLLVAGQTSATDFPTTPGSFQPAPPGQKFHVFVAKFDMATPAPSVCPSAWSVDFGTVAANQSNTKVVNVTNCGNAPLDIRTLTSSESTVSVKQSCGNAVKPGAVCPVSLVFKPQDSSAVSGTLTLTDNAQVSTQVISFSGLGGGPQLRSSAGSFNFGHLFVNTTGAPVELFFSNGGNAPLTITSAAVLGDFAINQNACTGTWQPNDSCYITITFSPSAAGIRTGTLTIASNDPAYPEASLSLAGVGDTTYAAPVITSLNSPTAQIGNGPIVVEVYGANFYPASVVTANGVPQPTTYSTGGEIQATLGSPVTNAMGEVSIGVSNPTPGGGTSVAVPLTLYQAVDLAAVFLTTVPGSSYIYASVPSSAPANPDTVIPINPMTGALGTPIPVGNNPGLLAPSSDGTYLFVVANDDRTVERINLSTGAVEAAFPFPPNGDTCCGDLSAVDLKAVPGSPEEVVLATNVPGYGFGEMALYNGSGMVNYVPTDTSSIVFAPAFSSFAYAGNPAKIYALPFTDVQNSFFSIITLGSQGLGYTPVTGANFGGNQTTGATVVSDGTLLYTSAGEVWNPATRTQTGTFPVTTLNATSYPNLYNLVIDTASSQIYVIGAQNYGADSSATVLSAYGQSSLALTGGLAFPAVQIPTVKDLVRWGTNGFAFVAQNSTGAPGDVVYILTSSLAAQATSNPVPRIVSLSPAATPKGSQDLQLTLNGQGFVESSVVHWNSSALQTSYVSSTVLTALLPATDLGTSGTASVAVMNPSPGGGNSNALQFSISSLAPLLSFSSNSLNFLPGPQAGQSGSAQTIAVENPGTATLNISAIAITGSGATSFQQTNTCGSSLTPGANCAVSVTFAPTASGPQIASLTFTDNAIGSPQSVSLSGTSALGLVSASGGSTSATVVAGGAATYNLAIGGAGLSATATITCSGTPPGATCSVPNSVAVNPASQSPFTVTVTTTSRKSAASTGHAPFFWAMLLLGMIALPRAAPRKWATRWSMTALPVLLLALLSVCSCGGGSSGPGGGVKQETGTPAGQYTLNVTASSGSSSQSVSLSLTVQ